jgi:opacity protein-like surface antigen
MFQSGRSAQLVLWLALSSFICGAALAQGDDYSRTGGYIAIGGVYAIEQFDSGPLDFSNGGGIEARVGYRGHRYASVEAQLHWSTGYSEEIFGEDIDVDLVMLTANARLHAPLGAFQPYALAGIGGLYARAEAAGESIDDTGFAFRVGGGLEFYATPNVVLDLGLTYVVTDGDVDGLDFLTIGGGIGYRF